MQKLLSAKNIKAIEESVQKAEEQTYAEIVPIIYQKSDFYPASHLRMAIFCATTFLIVSLEYLQIKDPAILIYGLLAFLCVGYFLAFIPSLKRFLTTNAEIKEEVYQRAMEFFVDNKLYATKKNSAVLIFISLMEKKALIFSDFGIKKEKSIIKIQRAFFKRYKSDNLAETLIHTIDKLTEILKVNHPVKEGEDNPNELADSFNPTKK